MCSAHQAHCLFLSQLESCDRTGNEWQILAVQVGLALLKKGAAKTGSVELTASGEVLLRFCGTIHSLAADLQTAAAESHATYPGRITVSTTDFLGKCTILQLLGDSI